MATQFARRSIRSVLALSVTALSGCLSHPAPQALVITHVGTASTGAPVNKPGDAAVTTPVGTANQPTGPVPAPPPALPTNVLAGSGALSGNSFGLTGSVNAPAAIIAGTASRLASNNGTALIDNNGVALIGNSGTPLIGKVKYRVMDAAGPSGGLANALVYLTNRDEKYFFNSQTNLPFATTSDAQGNYTFAATSTNGFPLGKDVVVDAALDGNLRMTGYLVPGGTSSNRVLDIASTLTTEMLRGDAYRKNLAMSSYPYTTFLSADALTRQAIQNGAIAAVTTVTDQNGNAGQVGTFDLRIDHVQDLRNQYTIAISAVDSGNATLKSLSDTWSQLLGYRPEAVTTLLGNGGFPSLKNAAAHAPVSQWGALAQDTQSPSLAGSQNPLGYPFGVATASTGDVFVSAYLPGQLGYIRWIKPNGQVSSLWLPNFALQIPAGLCVEKPPTSDPANPGTVLVADYAANRVYRIAIIDANQVPAADLDGSGNPLPAYKTQIVAGEATPADPGNDSAHPLVVDQAMASQYPALDSTQITGSGWRLYEEGPWKYLTTGNPVPNAARYCHLDGPGDVKIDEMGNIYIADEGNNRVRMIASAQANGQTLYGYRAPGAAVPSGAFKPSNGLDGNGRPTNLDPSPTPLVAGCIYTIVGAPGWGAPSQASFGSWTEAFGGDGAAAQLAQLNSPNAIAFANGKLYIADSYNQRVRMVDRTTGVITTVAGNPAGSPDPTNNNMYPAGLTDGDGLAIHAQLADPVAIALDNQNRLYIADANSGRIRMVDTTGHIATVAGRTHDWNAANPLGDDVTDGDALQWADLLSMTFLAADPNGNILLTETSHNRLRKLWRTWE